MYEAGLVFDSAHGDVLVFESSDQTHFNMHMKGIRGSLVTHSDRAGDRWTEDSYNRWGPDHIH